MLIAAAVYNVIFGIYAIFFPSHFFEMAGMKIPQYLELWQCIGMIVGVYGIGYLIAAMNPFRHWPIVLVGLLGKVFGPIGFLSAFIKGTFTASAGFMILFNDLIWWIPFAGILYGVYKNTFVADNNLIELFSNSDAFSLEMFETSEGHNLEEMSYKWPTMLIFLRHFGCTFCRESLSDLNEVRNKIEIKGTRIALVHMVSQEEAQKELAKYGLEDIPTISDPECILYKKFKLRRGTISQLFGWKVWVRGILAGGLRKHFVGVEKGDGFQMPGIFLLRKGKILKHYVHNSAADRPNFVQIAEEQ